MITYKARLGTFTSWPFQEDCNCTPDKMAEAGFYLVATVAEPAEDEPGGEGEAPCPS